MLVTRTITTNQPDALRHIARVAGGMRADIWHRFGALKGIGRSVISIKPEIPKLYGHLPIDGTIRSETAKDVINNIKAFEAAAKQQVRQAIYRRAHGDKTEMKRLYTLLKYDDWVGEPFLHRQMRKHFRHGHPRNFNQFVVRSDRFDTEIVSNKLCITIKIAAKYGENIVLIATTNGDGVNLKGKNLRIVLRDGHTEVHYAFDKGCGRVSGTEIIGVDKGYSEALVDSDGHFHGRKFGAILRDYTDKVHQTGKARGKLRAIEEKHRKAGRIAKADRIVRNNLGVKKQERRRDLAHRRLRTEAFKAVHTVVDKAAVVGAEDLTSVISRTKSWGRGFNRRMGFWAKGILAEALESVTEQRSARLALVNSAFTSQVSSLTRRLEGRREGDRFIAACGKVVHADVNGARNIRDRIDDPEITRFMPYRDVKTILLRRSSGGELPVKRPELGCREARQPGADITFCSEMSRF